MQFSQHFSLQASSFCNVSFHQQNWFGNLATVKRSLRWSLYLNNSVDKTKHSFVLPHRLSTTASLETNPIVFFLAGFLFATAETALITAMVFRLQNPQSTVHVVSYIWHSKIWQCSQNFTKKILKNFRYFYFFVYFQYFCLSIYKNCIFKTTRWNFPYTWNFRTDIWTQPMH